MSVLEKLIVYLAASLLLISLAFAAGFAFRHNSVWPTDEFLNLQRQVRFYAKHRLWGREGQFVRANVSAGQPRVEVLAQEEVLDGSRIFVGYDVDLNTYSARLLERDGTQSHTWPIDYNSILGLPPSLSGPEAPHGMTAMKDGSLIVEFSGEARAIVRIDPCGNPIWLHRGRYHHSVTLDDTGRIWTWHNDEDTDGQLDKIVMLDPETGETLRTIRLSEIAAHSKENALMMTLPEGFKFQKKGQIKPGVTRDLFHPNDVEPLSAAMAAAFPQFEPGDLLISLRNIDFVAVLDPQTLEIKWGRHGPWVRQHDPDFTAEGLIEVYNNNTGRARSNILAIDPQTGVVTEALGSEMGTFFSRIMGQHQRLPNSAHLIVVPGEGRVLEVARDGTPILEFNNIAADGINGRVVNAQWLPAGYFDSQPSCKSTQPEAL